HLSDTCALIQDQQSTKQVNYMGNAPWPPLNDPYAKTFNPSWRNHPNFGWGGQGNQGQRPYNNNFQQQQHPAPPMQPNVSQKLSQMEIAIQKLSQSTS
ncbi:hypothetical protein PIB30_109217, partial [Stylosanthes scabra]|nr:hypothetical protein [Stylosanthes scabra]